MGIFNSESIMKITGSTSQVQSPPARTTKPASGTGKPKTDEAESSRKAAAEARTRRDDELAAQRMKKMQSVDVTA